MSFTISTFNTHWGGRLPGGRAVYDLEAATRSFDADVRLFQEVWDHPDEPSRLWVPDGFAIERLVMGRFPRPARFELPAPQAERVGDFSLVLLSRFPVLERRVLELPATRKDPRRHALACRLDTPLGPVWIVGVHFTIGLLPLGSARQLRALIPQIPPDAPAVIVGDHNLWGPPARLLLGRGWAAAVRGKTWPAHRPRHQIDHIWVRRPGSHGGPGLAAADGRVLPDLGSDHLAITAAVLADGFLPETPQVLGRRADQ